MVYDNIFSYSHPWRQRQKPLGVKKIRNGTKLVGLEKKVFVDIVQVLNKKYMITLFNLYKIIIANHFAYNKCQKQ